MDLFFGLRCVLIASRQLDLRSRARVFCVFGTKNSESQAIPSLHLGQALLVRVALHGLKQLMPGILRPRAQYACRFQDVQHLPICTFTLAHHLPLSGKCA